MHEDGTCAEDDVELFDERHDTHLGGEMQFWRTLQRD